MVFNVVEVQQFDNQKSPFEIYWQTIDPEKRRVLGGWWNELKLNEDQFRNYKILHHHHSSFSVLDVMIVAWYVMGGVHSVPPKNVQKDLVALDAVAQTEERLTCFAFKAICNVILRALEPVEQIVKEKLKER